MTAVRWLTCSIPPSMVAAVADMDGAVDVLSQEMRQAWPVVAQATASLRGSLVGGTALTIHLRHRQSFDLDFLVHDRFDGAILYRELNRLAESSGLSCDLQTAESDSMHALVNGIVVQVFTQPWRGDKPGYVRQLSNPLVVDGMRVGSLPDLLATKLDVIMYRPKLRDYIDIAAIDQSGRYRIEDGLRFHMQRYGIEPTSKTPSEILRLLESPGRLTADRVFEDSKDETLEYLRMRAQEARAASGAWQNSAKTLTLRDNDDEHYRLSALSRRATCGAWMPKSRAYCVLPKNHRGHHRSR